MTYPNGKTMKGSYPHYGDTVQEGEGYFVEVNGDIYEGTFTGIGCFDGVLTKANGDIITGRLEKFNLEGQGSI